MHLPVKDYKYQKIRRKKKNQVHNSLLNVPDKED